MSGSRRLDVELPGDDGTTLRGWCFLPDGGGPFAGVVMAHGFSAVKEMALDRTAAVLAGAGFAVLAYDHRNLGASDGEPRQEIDIWAQTRDYRAAFDWLAAHPAVDAGRIAIWGSSFSGGEVLVVGALDARVAAVVAQVPFAGTGGASAGRSSGSVDPDGSGWQAMREALLVDPPAATEPAAGPMKVVTDRDGEPAMLAQPESWRWFISEGQRPGSTWRNECTVRLTCGSLRFDPGLAVAHVAPTPLLMIVATEDRLAATDVALAAFERAGEPKELLVVEGDHFVVYDGPTFDRCVGTTIEFLRRHLGG